MTRRLYILLLQLHPRAFRQRFGDEMLGIFEQSTGKGSLLADGFISLFRQRLLRRPVVVLAATVRADGLMRFYTAEPERPRAAAFIPATVISILVFGIISSTISHQWKHASIVVGSHHPSPSHILGVHTGAQAVGDLPAEVKMDPYPFHPPISPYFRSLLVLGALDLNQDNIISAAEMENGPRALWSLDKNHDGRLTAEECGLKAESDVDAATLAKLRMVFMHTNPVLAALDSNRDGEISDAEIANAAAALRTLDSNGDGKLVEGEVLPDPAVAGPAWIMAMLDANGDGKISAGERGSAMAMRMRELLNRADRDRKGYVTEDDLAKAMLRGN